MHLSRASESPASSKLSYHDGGACRDVGINDPNLSFPFTNLASHGENLGLSVPTEVRMDSGNENDVLTVIGDCVSHPDVIVPRVNETLPSYSEDTMKSSRDWALYYCSLVTKENTAAARKGTQQHQATLNQSQDIFPTPVTESRWRVNARKEIVQCYCGNPESEKYGDLKVVQEQNPESLLLLRDSCSETRENRLCRASSQTTHSDHDHSWRAPHQTTHIDHSSLQRPTSSQQSGEQRSTPHSDYQPTRHRLCGGQLRTVHSPSQSTSESHSVTPWGRCRDTGPSWALWVLPLLLLPTVVLADT
ncbi:hypothetical protein OTU49_003734, partial [Cherax quadricarinatus]